jgi:hypothetical protein
LRDINEDFTRQKSDGLIGDIHPDVTIKDVLDIALASDDHFKKLRILEVNQDNKNLFEVALHIFI